MWLDRRGMIHANRLWKPSQACLFRFFSIPSLLVWGWIPSEKSFIVYYQRSSENLWSAALGQKSKGRLDFLWPTLGKKTLFSKSCQWRRNLCHTPWIKACPSTSLSRHMYEISHLGTLKKRLSCLNIFEDCQGKTISFCFILFQERYVASLMPLQKSISPWKVWVYWIPFCVLKLTSTNVSISGF